jgi:hypothetical protein
MLEQVVVLSLYMEDAFEPSKIAHKHHACSSLISVGINGGDRSLNGIKITNATSQRAAKVCMDPV